MYAAYISDEDILFTRHYGKYEGAEACAAVLSTLAANLNAARLKAVCIDLSAVTSVTLENTDRAYGSFFLRELERFNQDIKSTRVVRVMGPLNYAVNEMIAERNQRITSHLVNLETLVTVYSVPEGLKALGLPIDYRIEYPAKN
jgi:hypothetical protein